MPAEWRKAFRFDLHMQKERMKPNGGDRRVIQQLQSPTLHSSFLVLPDERFQGEERIIETPTGTKGESPTRVSTTAKRGLLRTRDSGERERERPETGIALHNID